MYGSQYKEASPATTTYKYEWNCDNCQAATTTVSHLWKEIERNIRLLTIAVKNKFCRRLTQTHLPDADVCIEWVRSAGKAFHYCSDTVAGCNLMLLGFFCSLEWEKRGINVDISNAMKKVVSNTWSSWDQAAGGSVALIDYKRGFRSLC